MSGNVFSQDRADSYQETQVRFPAENIFTHFFVVSISVPIIHFYLIFVRNHCESPYVYVCVYVLCICICIMYMYMYMYMHMYYVYVYVYVYVLCICIYNKVSI